MISLTVNVIAGPSPIVNADAFKALIRAAVILNTSVKEK